MYVDINAVLSDARSSRANGGVDASLTFGRLLAELRQKRGMNQRTLAFYARIAASTLSEFENGRRIPPPQSSVLALSLALKASPEEQCRLFELAVEERSGIGVRVGSTVPAHVALLLRDVAKLSHRLSEVDSIRLRIYAKELIRNESASASGGADLDHVCNP